MRIRVTYVNLNKENSLVENEYEGEGTDEIQKYHIFKSDILCMSAGTMNEEGKSSDIVI